MKPEDRLLLICLRQNFTERHSQAVAELEHSTPLDWDRIALTAEQHGVSAIISRNLSLCRAAGLDLPDKALQKLKMSTYKSAIAKERQTERLIRALAFFGERNLEVMLIKGAALDLCVYQDGNYVLADDVDVMIHARQENYSQDYIQEIVVFLHAQGIEFEFYSHHDLDINGLLPIDYESIWENAVHAEYHGYPVLLMSSTDLLFSLLVNSSRKRYFRLKSLCDISETIQTNQDISWQHVAEKARINQCENIIFTALLVTSLTTGCNMPVDWRKYFKIHPVRQQIINGAVNFLLTHISFYPYPNSGISILGRPMHLSLILPYIGYTRTQIGKKLSLTFHLHNNIKSDSKLRKSPNKGSAS